MSIERLRKYFIYLDTLYETGDAEDIKCYSCNEANHKMTLDDSHFDTIAAPSSGELNDIELRVARATEIINQLSSIEELTKQLGKELREITEQQLPDLMASAGVSEFKTKAGVKVKIHDFVRGSLPKEEGERKKALTWIEDQGAGDLIKDRVSIEFGRKEHNFAIEVRSILARAGVEFESKMDVHPQTLAAFARERLSNGESLPLDLLGLYAGRAAKVTVPKGDK